MRNSGLQTKKIASSSLFRGIRRQQSFSQVSQQGSLSQAQEKQQLLQDELNWTQFHASNAEIEALIQSLIPKYKQYRKYLCETAKQICFEGNISHFNYQKLLKQQKNQIQDTTTTPTPLDDKLNTIQKIVSERRIKKYYKDKHQVNFQDELDPEDDQQEIYRLYQKAFASNESTSRHNIQPQNVEPQDQYNQHLVSRLQVNPGNRQNTNSSIENKVLQLSNPYPIQFEESFQKMKLDSPAAKRINYTKLNDPFVGFEHELSFDVKNQQYFINNSPQIDAYGFDNDDMKYQINSEMNYDTQKLKKFNKNSRTAKDPDQLSHSDNIYRNFIQKQNEELNKQKQRVQQLTEKALKVLNNDVENPPSEDEEDASEDRISQLRYIFGEIVEIYSVQECLKFQLKYKSFQLLNRLYENASNYYGQQIKFEQPLQVKYMSQIIRAAIPQTEEDGIRIVVQNIFGQSSQMSFDAFVQKLSASINQKQYQVIQSGNYVSSTSKTLDETVRLFNIWIEQEYFQKQLKDIFDRNPDIIDKFIQETSENGTIVPQMVTEFIAKSKKFNKVKKMKAQIFLRKMLGDKFNVSEFYRWVDVKKEKINKTFQKTQQEKQFDYYNYLY